MSSGLNRCTFIGNLGADPEVRYSAAGSAVCEIRLAVSESWKDKQTGEKKERTEWVRVTFFGKLAEIVGEYCKKGKQIYVAGRMHTEEYERDGVKKWATKIMGDEMLLLGGAGGERSDGSSARQPQQRQAPARGSAPPSGRAAPQSATRDGFEDDDIPF